MGMYTGIRCKIKLKPEFIPVIQSVIEERSWDNTGHECLSEYSQHTRATFIPFGVVCYMPSSWGEYHPDWDNTIDSDGWWAFQCSLKNYDCTIEYFLDKVVPEIAEEAYIEYFYEQWARSKFYALKDGKVILHTKEGILYGFED